MQEIGLQNDQQVQKASIHAFVKSCSNFNRQDQGVYSYLFILRVCEFSLVDDQFAQDTVREKRIIACKLFHDAACILGSEVLSQFGVSELLLLAQDPYTQVRKHAVLALGPVAGQLDPTIVENGIYNCLLKNTQSSSWIVRRACAIVIPEVFSNIRSPKYFLSITKTVGELFRDEFGQCYHVTNSSRWVKEAMLQGLGHLIAIIPEDFNVISFFQFYLG